MLKKDLNGSGTLAKHLRRQMESTAYRGSLLSRTGVFWGLYDVPDNRWVRGYRLRKRDEKIKDSMEILEVVWTRNGSSIYDKCACNCDYTIICTGRAV